MAAVSYTWARIASWRSTSACAAWTWRNRRGLLVVWEGWDHLADADPDTFEMALEVFQDACVAWKDDEVPGAVLLKGDGPETDIRGAADYGLDALLVARIHRDS